MSEVMHTQNAINSGLRQAFGSRFLAGVLVLAVAVLFGSAESLIRVYRDQISQPAGYHMELILRSMTSDTAISFLPMAAVLPFAGSFVDDIKSKFARFFCIRSGWRGYLGSRLHVCFLSGGLTAVGGALTALGAARLLLFRFVEPGDYDRWILADTLLRYFLCGGFWALAGMALSTLMESKYIAYASTFVLYYLLVIVHERYLPDQYVLDPNQWICPQEFWPYGVLGQSVIILELTILFGVLFTIRAERRLRGL